MIVKYFNKKNKSKSPNPVNKFHSLGIYYLKTGKYEKAIDFFKKVLIIDPEHTDSKDKIKLLIKKFKKEKNSLNEKHYCIIDGYLINNKIENIGTVLHLTINSK